MKTGGAKGLSQFKQVKGLTEALEELNKLNNGSEISDELMDNISLLSYLVNGLYITN